MTRSIPLLLLYATAITVILITFESYWIRIIKRSKFLHLVPLPPPPPPGRYEVGNIPRLYLTAHSLDQRFNETCAFFPKLFDLKFTVEPWQVQKTSNGTFHLFSAHFDDRGGEGKIRIIAMFDQVLPNQTFYCQIWYWNLKRPEIVPASDVLMLWMPAWGGNWRGLPHPYIITCPSKPAKVPPISVSLVEKPCQNSSNNLRVNYPKEERVKKDFVVCVKGLNFPYKDISLRLVEWIEFVFIMGADKISFYQFAVHPRTEQVLKYYQQLGMVEVLPIRLIGGAPSNPFLQYKYLLEKRIQRRLQEVIPYNDCLYRHLKEYKFVVLLDVDEMVVPADGTWRDIMENLAEGKKNRSSFVMQNVFFLNDPPISQFEDIPSYTHMLQHVFRTKNYSDSPLYVKGFHNTEWVVGLHNHYPIHCLDKCKNIVFLTETAHLQHYKNPRLGRNQSIGYYVNNSVMDTRIWNFKDLLIERVGEALNKMNLFVNRTVTKR